MNIPLDRLTLTIGAVVFGGFGVVLLLDPAPVLSLAHITLTHPSSFNEARAFFGGVEIALAAYLWHCRTAYPRSGLVLLALVLGGITVGRVLGLVVDGREGNYVFYAMSTEIPVLAMSLAALKARG